MNKLYYLLAVCAFVGTLCLSTSCNDEVGPLDPPVPDEVVTTLTVNPLSLTFTADGGSQTIKIKSNTSWTVTPNAGWVTVSPMTGEGDATVVISAPELEKLEDRSCEITVQTDDNEKDAVVSVVQAGAQTVLSLDVTELIFEEMAKCERSVNVTSNTQWSITGVPEWLDASTKNGNGNATVTFITARDNNSSTELEGEITISTSNGASCALKVSQKGMYIANCQVHIENLLTMANSAAFEVRFDKNVAYYYADLFYPEEIEYMIDSEIIDVLMENERWIPDTSTILDFYADPRTDYVVCFVAFDKNDQQGDLTMVNITTPTDVNQPRAYVSDVYYSYDLWEWETTIGAYCSYYYSYEESVKSAEDLVLPYISDATFALSLKERIEADPEHYSRAVQSGSWKFPRESNHMCFETVTWGVDVDGNYSSVLDGGIYLIDDTRSAQSVNKVKVDRPKVAKYNMNDVNKSLSGTITLVVK